MTNPANGEIVTSEVQVAGAEDVDAAVAAARAAFKGPWRKFSGAQRAACMHRLADLIEANIEKLAKLESIAMGQPIGVAKVFLGICPPGWRCELLASPPFWVANARQITLDSPTKLGVSHFQRMGTGSTR